METIHEIGKITRRSASDAFHDFFAPIRMLAHWVQSHSKPEPRTSTEHTEIDIGIESAERISTGTQQAETRYEHVIPVGHSAAMKRLFTLVERAAPTNVPIHITGGSGTGKELVARMIHAKSGRGDHEFVTVNVSTLPSSLVSAELFGVEGTARQEKSYERRGLIELSSGGTLFLDDVEALPPESQAQLLQVIREGRIRRLGGKRAIPVDLRIVSASTSDLASAVEESSFRADLFYRLRVVGVYVPYLFERTGDIEILIEHFLKRFSEPQNVRRFSPEAMRLLVEYPWPGNVRELRNAVQYALAIGRGSVLDVEDLPPEIYIEQSHAGLFENTAPIEDIKKAVALSEDVDELLKGLTPLAEVERRYILSVLQHFRGNQVRTAAVLGIDRSKLYRRLKQYGVVLSKYITESDQSSFEREHDLNSPSIRKSGS